MCCFWFFVFYDFVICKRKNNFLKHQCDIIAVLNFEQIYVNNFDTNRKRTNSWVIYFIETKILGIPIKVWTFQKSQWEISETVSKTDTLWQWHRRLNFKFVHKLIQSHLTSNSVSVYMCMYAVCVQARARARASYVQKRINVTASIICTHNTETCWV